jgi:hypothetical protein
MIFEQIGTASRWGRGVKSVEPCFWEYTVPFYASVVSPSPHWCYDPRHGYAAISGRRPDRRGSGGGDDVADGRTDTG